MCGKILLHAFLVYLICGFYNVKYVNSHTLEISKGIIQRDVKFYDPLNGKQLLEELMKCDKDDMLVRDFYTKLSMTLEKIKQDKVPYLLLVQIHVRQLEKVVGKIDELYSNLVEYYGNKDYALIDETNFIEQKEGVNNLLDELFNEMIVTSNVKAALAHYLNQYYEKIYPCSRKSKQQFFNELLISILLTEIKGRAVALFAYETLKEAQHHIKYIHSRSSERIKQIFNVFEDIISKSSRTIRRCDISKKHVEDKTYTKLNNLFERVLYSFSYYTCPGEIKNGKCVNKDAKIGSKLCLGDNCLDQRSCGHVVNCVAPSDSEGYDVCLEKDQSKGSRYQYVKYGNLQSISFYRLLTPYQCKSKNSRLLQASKSNGYGKTSINSCICDEQEKSDRRFSLEAVTSNTQLNYVITGVRLVKKNKIVRIQIQEGKLSTYGHVDERTVKWKPVDEATWLESDFLTFKIDWDNNRGIYFNTAEAPKNHVITGIGFATVLPLFNDPRKFLTIEIQTTEVDLETGKLLLDTTSWRRKFFYNLKNSDLYEIDKLNAPTKCDKVHQPGFYKRSLTFFTPTGVDTADTGSSVVPYLDTRPVYSEKPVAISSVGLEHLGAEGSGGYLALTTETFDAMSYL